MCIKCTYDQLSQLRWELVVQEGTLRGVPVSEEVVATVKEQAKGKGPILPRVRLERPDGMNDLDYGEAKDIFKQGMLLNRQTQIAAIEVVMTLLEMEVFQDQKVVKVNAGAILNAGDENGEADV